MPAFITSGDCPSLNDNYPAIIFADACSNSDTDNLNIGQAMMQQGAVAFEGATKVALGCPGWADQYDGSSQSLDYFYTTYITSGDYTVGAAHQRALRNMYTYGLWSYNKYETCEWGALWGNPNLTMGEIIQSPLAIDYPDGLPDYAPPGEQITINVQIDDLAENYVPGSGTIHYRYSDGTFNELQLTHLNDNQYQAVLPSVYCESQPEYYFSAQGDGGSTMLDPLTAPADYFSSQVGILTTLMTDDFETDLGWTVNGNAVDGQWERGIPVGGGDRGDPPTDFDGSGRCYLTDNVDDNSDVDDGSTFLISPTIDLSEGTAYIKYAVWYSNNIGDNPNADYFVVWISNNNGSTWVPVDSIGPVSTNAWAEYSFAVDEFITPTAGVKVRFEASDLNGGSVVEAAVDAFKIERFECENPGYAYLPGDVNMHNGDWPPVVIGGDVTYLVNYFRNLPISVACYLDDYWASADANGDCQVIGSDVTKLVNYFRDIGDLQYCPDYEPLWYSPDDLPDVAPDNWPGCE
jgi:hypothetical protein